MDQAQNTQKFKIEPAVRIARTRATGEEWANSVTGLLDYGPVCIELVNWGILLTPPLFF